MNFDLGFRLDPSLCQSKLGSLYGLGHSKIGLNPRMAYDIYSFVCFKASSMITRRDTLQRQVHDIR